MVSGMTREAGINPSVILSRPLVPDLPAAGRRGSTTRIPSGVHPQARARKVEMRTRLAAKPMTCLAGGQAQAGWRHSQVVRFWAGVSLCRKESLE